MTSESPDESKQGQSSTGHAQAPSAPKAPEPAPERADEGDDAPEAGTGTSPVRSASPRPSTDEDAPTDGDGIRTDPRRSLSAGADPREAPSDGAKAPAESRQTPRWAAGGAASAAQATAVLPAVGTGEDAAEDTARTPEADEKRPAPAATPSGDAPRPAVEKSDRPAAAKSAQAPPPVRRPEPVPPVAPPRPPAADTPGPKAGERPAGVPGPVTTARPGTQPGPPPGAGQPEQRPRPPLDLLAQLTNTPAPPQTPMRSVARRFKIWGPVVVVLAVGVVTAQMVRPLPKPTLALEGSASYTFQGGFSVPWPDHGQSAAKVVGAGSLGTSGEQKPVPTASVAKVMTAYVILKEHPLKKGESGEQITLDAQAEADSAKKDESRVPLKTGQRFTQEQMLQMLMIPSGNNVARQLARWDAGSEDAFAEKMNKVARELGMKDTVYTDPSGFLESTKSTAADQLKLAEAVMQNDVFRQVVRMPSATIPGLEKPIYNNNALLTTQPGTAGIKTGSTTPAGGALMWAAYRTVDGKDQLILGVTMDQRTSGGDSNAHLKRALDNTQKVIAGIRDGLVSATVVKKGQVVGYVDDGLDGRTPLVATADLKSAGWPGLKPVFKLADGGRAVPHEAKAGTEVGVLTVGDGPSAAKVPVALQKDLSEPGFGSKLVRIG
ncbi:D-alanyl-D-alanine carboxypeptidase family protein [Streptomyces netropsis]|uniref:D-alanyl-D-alanine carboxypeptidase n=1 Tax=Streptomyces netropsis TaxID=55404 RepID=A0A7W7L8M8_STRNE|nr:serine hydrolase [Streptomyces netropsis]MBB4885509.1 D-alanyl-D-alanine carboxypeptidase [Streptomyces netropsis]